MNTEEMLNIELPIELKKQNPKINVMNKIYDYEKSMNNRCEMSKHVKSIIDASKLVDLMIDRFVRESANKT